MVIARHPGEGRGPDSHADLRNFKKLVIIGISGTGKSFFARNIANKSGTPLYHMDSIIWSPHWIETKQEDIVQTLAKITESENWIVEGWIDTYSKDILEQADVIVYLDYPGWLAAWGGFQRWWKYKGKKRPEMPDGCNEAFDFSFLMTMLLRKERPHIEAVLNKLNLKSLVRVRSQGEVKSFLNKWQSGSRPSPG